MRYVHGWSARGSTRSWGCKKLFFSFILGSAIIAGSTIVLLILAFMQAYRFWWQSPNHDVPSVRVDIAPGTSLKGISHMLAEQDVIASAGWFRTYVALSGHGRSIPAGTAFVFPGDAYADVTKQLIRSQAEEMSVTLLEGWRLDQLYDALSASLSIDIESWQGAIGVTSSNNDHPFVVAAQKPEGVDLEGYLFPDTYRFFSDASSDDVVEKLLDTMQERVTTANIIPPDGWTMHDVLTLASIVQREVARQEDMAMVADVFLKRLEIGMALQSDATVNYLTRKNDPTPSADDLSFVSPYNTYQHPGLPPGPIASPGIDAIRAVVAPVSNPYYYYLTNETGEVIYARTHDQHVANKAKYLR